MTDQSLPDPLVGPNVDLRDFQFMPLDVSRLRDSDLAAQETSDACWSAVLLWCASWHQVPAASLPDDDRTLANLAGFGRVIKEWSKVKAGALRGWVKCADGRLYHPVVAEKANEAWVGKLRQRWSTECARVKKYNQRHQTELKVPDFQTWVDQGQPITVPGDNAEESLGTHLDCPDEVPGETPSKGQGEGQGKGEDKEEESLRASSGEARLGVTKILADEVWAMAGIKPEAFRAAGKTSDVEAVAKWLDGGASPDEIRTACRTKISTGKEIKSLWGYLAKTVPEAIDALRGAALLPPKPRDTAEREQWRLIVKLFLDTGFWPAIKGHKPGHPDCRCPPDIQAEYGLLAGRTVAQEMEVTAA